VKTLGPGNVFGGTTFFDESVWTLSAVTMGAVELSVLAMDSVDEWGEVYPALESKLQVYCKRFDKINEFFVNSGAERRAMERFPLTGMVCLTLLDEKGKSTDTSVQGECRDISIGGLSFVSRIANRKQARTLLGRKVELIFGDDESPGGVTRLTGTVVAVRNLHTTGSDRSVHIQFDALLDPNEKMDIVNAK
jgi:hypothetical protein